MNKVSVQHHVGSFHLQATVDYVIGAVQDRERQGKPQDYVMLDCQPASYAVAYTALQGMKAAGLTLVPCCDNVDKTGRCQGAG